MRSAFTLIELLVVITIIVVLLAILLPAMEDAAEHARRAKCGANLHAWGIALVQYHADNGSKLPSTARNFGGAYPSWPWVRKSNAPAEDVSAELLAPYVAGVDLDGYTLKGLWYCPNNGAAIDRYNTNFAKDGHNFFVVGYSLFTRVGLWEGRATRPDDLTDRHLSGNRLLMSDVIFRWWVNNGWSYNHGRDGYSVFETAQGGPTHFGAPPLIGANQLFGDGGVRWKDGSAFNTQAMEAGDPNVPTVLGGGGGIGDRTYY